MGDHRVADIKGYATMKQTVRLKAGKSNDWQQEHLVGDIWPLRLGEERDGGVGLGRQNIYKGIGVAVQRNGRARLQQFPIERWEDADIVVWARGGSYNARVGVDHLQKLPNDQWNWLDALHFLLRTQQLTLEAALLLFDVFLLQSRSVCLTMFHSSMLSICAV